LLKPSFRYCLLEKISQKWGRCDVKPHFALNISVEVAAWMTFPAASNVPPIPMVSLTALDAKAKSSSLFIFPGRDDTAMLSPLPCAEDDGESVESPINSCAFPSVAAISTKLLGSERVDVTA
jgi:hypothetical protein